MRDLDVSPYRAAISQRRERIHRVALNLFQQFGYHATTTLDIARAAYVSRGTFYKYFPSKAAVILAHVQPLIADLRRHVERLLHEGVAPPDVLDALCNQVSAASERERTLIAPLVQEVLATDAGDTFRRAATSPLMNVLNVVADALHERGLLREHVSPRQVSTAMMDSYLITVLRWNPDTSALSFRDAWRLNLDMLLHGALRRPPHA
ncbi:TetR/AcrR family transcriptional regulator [Deinococcus maricopensis]|uniref:Regulatory protein TetR n=1 Tax=Deinococcus maricopensis (strain DSM 21211 / LMG 22137 / NRRL B-23946 / LB-34) TaxID=709986 RepID=E8U712_DEIML|nr:TetR/AcrR family transcriptional regulator [Deinococcus maricopensis]ADV66851.1 regulatory protein TetR [Deinococcus maricopensis DSM 21211]